MPLKVSVIIPVKERNNNLDECLYHCRLLNYLDFEIIVVPDTAFDYPGIKVLPSGPVGPSIKRDLALEIADGDIVAFLDDDAYPMPEWLTNAVKYFDDARVAAVGGPAVTAPSDNFLQKASGLVFSSFLASGNVAYRYLPKKRREVDDYPSCNLLVRKSVLQELGGFNTAFWPGEDTVLCLQIIKKLRQKIVYAPDVVVYHHRRPLFTAHLRQVWGYAVHRGYFMKKFPGNSLRAMYFAPTVFIFLLITGGVLALYSATGRRWYLIGLALYFIIILLVSLKAKRPLMTVAVTAGIFATHIFYGIGLIRGLTSSRLKEEIKARAIINEGSDFISPA